MKRQEGGNPQSQELNIIRKVKSFERLVESSVNQQYLSHNNDEIRLSSTLKQIKIKNRDLIDPIDGTKLAAFVDGDEDSEPDYNLSKDLINIVNISWSYPPMQKKKQQEDKDDLLSSFEMV